MNRKTMSFLLHCLMLVALVSIQCSLAQAALVPCENTEMAAEGWKQAPPPPEGAHSTPSSGGNIQGANRIVSTVAGYGGISGIFVEPNFGGLVASNKDRPTMYFGAEQLNAAGQAIVKVDCGIYWIEQMGEVGQPGFVEEGWTTIISMSKGKCNRQGSPEYVQGKPYRVPYGQLGAVQLQLQIRPVDPDNPDPATKDGLLDLTISKAAHADANPNLPPGGSLLGYRPFWGTRDGKIDIRDIRMRRNVGMTQSGFHIDGSWIHDIRFGNGKIAEISLNAQGYPLLGVYQSWTNGDGLDEIVPWGKASDNYQGKLDKSYATNPEVMTRWVIDFKPYRRNVNTGTHDLSATNRYREEVVDVNLLQGQTVLTPHKVKAAGGDN